MAYEANAAGAGSEALAGGAGQIAGQAVGGAVSGGARGFVSGIQAGATSGPDSLDSGISDTAAFSFGAVAAVVLGVALIGFVFIGGGRR